MNKAQYTFAGQETIISPQLIYYPEIICENIRRMIEIAGGTERLWPHVKTHKMGNVVKLLIEAGISRFKCATIAEAEMAAKAGATHLIVAYPLVGPNIGRFLKLSAEYPEVMFYAIGDNDEQIALLGKSAMKEGRTVRVLMDVDMGQHRTGVALDKVTEKYCEWANYDGIRMNGMHCYDGHLHETNRIVRNKEVIREDYDLKQIKKRLITEGQECPVVVMGGTPTFPCHAGITEEYLSPGTCVIQDFGYKNNYPDMDFEPAAAVLTRVVSRPSENTFTLDMGTKAVASDPSGERAVLCGMEYARTVMHNEEHWVVCVPEEHIGDIPSVGAEMFAIPTHICPTSALYPEVSVVVGHKLVDWWHVTARDRKLIY